MPLVANLRTSAGGLARIATLTRYTTWWYCNYQGGTYLFPALQPAAAGTLLEDLTLILGVFAALAGRLALLIDTSATGHCTKTQRNPTFSNTAQSNYISERFHGRKHKKYYSTHTFSQNHILQGCKTGRHRGFGSKHYSRYPTFERYVLTHE